MRRIVFLGNCYAGTLCSVYSDAIAPLTGDEVGFVAAYSNDDPASRQLLIEADVIVAQMFDADQAFSFDMTTTDADVVAFPTVRLQSLWPFGGVAHLQNEALPYWVCGPYDHLLGDNYLNRRLREGTAPEVAVKDYLALDVARVTHVDRIHEISMDRQLARDEACGMYFADEIEAHFRTEHLFLNHNRLNTRMAGSLSRQVFARLGIEESIVEAIISRWVKTPFERTELPIHPAVAKHFALDYGGPDQRYLYHTGERLTFEEYATRYALSYWNEPLLRGVGAGLWAGGDHFAAHQGEVASERLEAAVSDLRLGLASSRGSSLGSRVLGGFLSRLGQNAPALAALEQAVRLDPTDAESQVALGCALSAAGRAEEAETAFRAAIAHDPWHGDGYFHLGRLLSDMDRVDEALTVLEALVRIRPGNPYTRYDLGRLYMRAHRGPEAEAALRRAADGLAHHARPKLYLAEVLLRQNPDSTEGASLLQEAAGLQTEDASIASEMEAVARRLASARIGALV